MIEQRLFHVEDIKNIKPIDWVTEDIVKEVLESPCSWTVLSKNIPVCIWGKIAVWNGRGIIWALMGEGSRSCMKQLIEYGRDTMAHMPESRLEATTKVGFFSGIRFLELLGFQREGTMRKFSAFGDDEYLYARVI